MVSLWGRSRLKVVFLESKRRSSPMKIMMRRVFGVLLRPVIPIRRDWPGLRWGTLMMILKTLAWVR